MQYMRVPHHLFKQTLASNCAYQPSSTCAAFDLILFHACLIICDSDEKLTQLYDMYESHAPSARYIDSSSSEDVTRITVKFSGDMLVL